MGASALRSRRLYVALFASAVVMILALPASATDYLVEGEFTVVAGTQGSGLNIRSEPSSSAEVQFIADEGTPMQITSGPQDAEGSTWYGVNVEGQDAWVMSEFIADYASQAGDQVKVVQTDGHGLRLRAEASSNSDTLTVLSEGSTVDVVGSQQTDQSGVTWANVSYNGTAGFVHTDYVAVVSVAGEETSGLDASSNEDPAPEQTGTEQDGDSGEGVQEDPEPEPEPAAEPEPEPDPAPSEAGGLAVGGNAEIVDTGGDGLNIRHGAGYGNSVATVASEGHVVQILGGPEVDGDGANWWNVDYRGLNGWAHGGYLQATEAEPTQAGSASGASNSDDDGGSEGDVAPPASSPVGEQIVNEAMQYLGYPYVWGGTTPAGFDCSGFLYYVVNQVTGDGFPRLLESQVNRGSYVPSDDLQPGDLVFQQNTYQWGLSHAGVYIGNGQFIHASTPGSGVVISNLWDSYWGQRYYTARRIS